MYVHVYMYMYMLQMCASIHTSHVWLPCSLIGYVVSKSRHPIGRRACMFVRLSVFIVPVCRLHCTRTRCVGDWIYMYTQPEICQVSSLLLDTRYCSQINIICNVNGYNLNPPTHKVYTHLYKGMQPGF